MTLEQFIWVILIALFLGTAYHYYNLRKQTVAFWKIAKPNMSKEQVSKILDTLLNGSDEVNIVTLEYEQKIQDLHERVYKSISEMLEMGREYTNTVYSMYKHIKKRFGTDVAEEVFNSHRDELDSASKHLENLADLWPECIRKEVVERENDEDEE